MLVHFNVLSIKIRTMHWYAKTEQDNEFATVCKLSQLTGGYGKKLKKLFFSIGKNIIKKEDFTREGLEPTTSELTCQCFTNWAYIFPQSP